MKRLFLLFMLLFSFPVLVFHTGCKKSDISPDSLLQGVKWILESIQYSDQSVVPIEETFYMQYGTAATQCRMIGLNTCASHCDRNPNPRTRGKNIKNQMKFSITEINFSTKSSKFSIAEIKSSITSSKFSIPSIKPFYCVD